MFHPLDPAGWTPSLGRFAFATLLLWGVGAGCGNTATPPSGAALHFDACAPVTLVLDVTASSAQIAGARDGVTFWNRSAGSAITVGMVDSSGADSGAEPDAGPRVPLHFQTAAAPFHGLYEPDSGEMFVNMDLANHPLAVAIAHEVGHAFGLVHVPAAQRASVMNAGNLDVEPTIADVADLADLWGACAPAAPTAASTE